MQKSRVLRISGFGMIEYLQKNSFLLISLFLLLLGFIFGVFIFDNFEILKNYPNQHINDYINSRMNVSFGKILITSMLDSCFSLFILFLLGSSLFGVITVPCAVFVKGFFIGGIISFLYAEYGLKGIAFNAIIYIPPVIIFMIIMLVAGCYSIKFSIKITSLTLNKTMPFNLANDFRDYSIKYLFFGAATFISSIVDALLSVGLIKNFSLLT